MVERTLTEYIKIYYPTEQYPDLAWDKETEEFRELESPPVLRSEIKVRAIGKSDNDGKTLYQGDIVTVDIQSKYGTWTRVGIIRTEGLYFCGIEYFNKEGLITDEGDFIDEFYITNIKRICHIFEAEADKTFNPLAYGG
mgnify:CR=1 FL=1